MRWIPPTLPLSLPALCVATTICTLTTPVTVGAQNSPSGTAQYDRLVQMYADQDKEFLAVRDTVTYNGLEAKGEVETKQGVALLVARTQLREVPEELLQKLSEQVAANCRNPSLKLVTLADLNADSREARNGRASKGTLLDFANNQNVVNEAIARGIAMVLFVDLTHFNSKAATVPGAEGMSLLNARALRLKGIDRDIKTRGFDARDLTDKAFDLLAKDLGNETTRWKLSDIKIKMSEIEVHAKIEGIQFPMIDLEDSGQIKIKEVEVFAEGASVEVDGVLKGQAPCRISVAPGTHKLKVFRDGTTPFQGVIQANGEKIRYEALLVPNDEYRRKFDEQLAKFERVKTMALRRGVEMEREAVRTEGMRVANKNAQSQGNAIADVIQSRADVARTDADSRGKIATGKAAVLQSQADTGRTKAEADADMTRAQAGAVTVGANSKADVARIDAEARAKVATGETAVLQGKAAILTEQSKGQANLVSADAELKLSEAEANRKGAEGKLAIDKASADSVIPVLKAKLEATKEQTMAWRSFAENLGSLGFKVLLNFKSSK
ncbi:MAG: PEGA domain-containing protein [Verrucomicrobia bacterium]|nr:PEGA domain-containing protein [Verrucomicrobiota bacterium]